MASKACVYFCPIYASGHLISMVELAQRLLQLSSVSGNSFSIHFILMLPDNPNHDYPLCQSYLQSIQAQHIPIQFHVLPSVEPPTCFDGVMEYSSILVRSHLPHIKAVLLASPSSVSGLVIDVFASDVIDVANELNIPSYIYNASNATSHALFSHFSIKDGENDQNQFSEVEEIYIPGFKPLPSTCLPSPLFELDRKSASCKWLMHLIRNSSKAKAVIINTNIYLEKTAVEAFTHGTPLGQGKILPHLCPVGPVVSLSEVKSQEHECLKWLDKQSTKSVLFLCFGSVGTFELCQIRQIASALEQSGHRFLWVLRTPSNSKEFLR